MDKQLENGYKDTALEIAGKCINIKPGYCMLLKSIVLYFSSSSMNSSADLDGRQYSAILV